jgi:hypothetical protein
MMMVILMSMGKTFFYLRIFSSLSPIISMLKKVIIDLQVFMLFFFILLYKFSLVIDIMGIGNRNIDGAFRDEFGGDDVEYYPGQEFKSVGLFVGNILTVFRITMGDFAIITASEYMTDTENAIFWLIFFLILVMTNIIFLNFVIAEAGNSYNEVKE